MMSSIDVRIYYKFFIKKLDYENLEKMILKTDKNNKEIKKVQEEKKKVSGLKQKLLFYLAFLKKKNQQDLNIIKEEV